MRVCLAILGSLALAMAATACRHDAPAGAPPRAVVRSPQKVLVFAAASTSEVIEELKSIFSPIGIQLQSSYASSSTLAQQILHGADADVFISADQESANLLAKKLLVAESKPLLGNRLVVIVPADSTLEVHSPADLASAKLDRIAVGDPDSVPAGKYAKRALVKLGVWDKLQGKVVSAADVRQALTYVETGAAAAGVVYATDAAASKKVRVACEIPEEITGPVRYPVVLLTHANKNAAAKVFYRFLFSEQAADIFRKHGFTVLDSGK